MFDVSLAFKQGKIFTFLKNRAEKLKRGNFKAASKIESEMTEWKNKNFEDSRRPVYVFITVETEDVKNKISKLSVPFFEDRL